MAVTNGELIFYKPEEVSDLDTNGGRKSINSITSNSPQNTFGNVFSAERLAGSKKYRKIFCTVANADNLSFDGAWGNLFDVTPSDSFVYFFEGTPTDTQADIVGTEPKYGTARLSANVLAGSAQIEVKVEDAVLDVGNDLIFRDGGTITITNKYDYTSATGSIETHVINGTPTVAGTTVTITLTDTLANDYTYSDTPATKVQSMPNTATVECVVDNWDITSIGTTTVTQAAVYGDNIGCIDQEVTITMTGATTFNATSNVSGVILGAGVIGTDFTPQNSDFSRAYFTIPADAIGGSPVTGDEFIFETHCPDLIVWEVREIPTNCGSLSGDNVSLQFAGESA